MDREAFLLDPSIVYLNHGSYGATPLKILREQQQWQNELERQPVQFMNESLSPLIHKSRSFVADYFNIEIDGLVFVTNATTGVNTVLMQRIKKGMKVVCTQQRYNAVSNSLSYWCAQKEATLIELPLPHGVYSSSQLTSFLLENIDCDVDFLVLDEISSANATRFPIQQLANELRSRNSDIEILVDGAHSPGKIDIDAL